MRFPFYDIRRRFATGHSPAGALQSWGLPWGLPRLGNAGDLSECTHHGAELVRALDGEMVPAPAATAALGVMGLLAAMPAVTGIFGMAAYSVSRRKKEPGMRVVVGARRTQVMSAAVRRPIVLLGVGSAPGLLSGVSASRLLGGR